MMYCVIYDSHCNLCTNLVRWLEAVDRGQRFQYLPMQNQAGLAQYGIAPADCEAGMILVDQQNPTRRWQGSNAAEEIGRLLPMGQLLVDAYRALPGAKQAGDQLYGYVRDHRYELFGQRAQPYQSAYPLCDTGHCPDGQLGKM
jgi:predicted DCC family thiol-disulfide oxidoreductase YuxK